MFAKTTNGGTSLAPALRIHSKYLRTRLRQQAQASARKVGVKLIFPVFFLIFPSVLLVTLGPAIIMVYNQIQTMLNGMPPCRTCRGSNWLACRRTCACGPTPAEIGTYARSR